MQYGLYVFGDAPARDAVLLDLASPAGDLRRLGVDIELVKDPHLLWLMWKSEGLSRLDLPALSARHPDTIIRLAWMDDEGHGHLEFSEGEDTCDCRPPTEKPWRDE